MNKLFRKISILFCILLLSTGAFAQQPDSLQLMRSNGKIYVVVASCFIILVGLFLYAYRIDRKLSKLEKDN
jgi:hypothetical protein